MGEISPPPQHETIAEWRVSFDGVVTQSDNFRNSEFRNPNNGESVLPTQLYVEFSQNIQKDSFWTGATTSALGLFLFHIIKSIPYIVMDGTTTTTLGEKFMKAFLLLILAFVVFVLTLAVVFRMTKGLGLRNQQRVDECREEFLRHGVDLGYHRSNTVKYVWMRRRSHSSSLSSSHEKTDSSMISAVPKEEYPPIYLHLSVPGDIHIDETEYDSSMVMDEKTWTLIKDMQTLNAKKYRGLEITAIVLGTIFVLYTMLLFVPIELLGIRMALFISFTLLVSCIVSSYTSRQLTIRSYQQVTEQVNQKLITTNDKKDTVSGYSYQLKLETSSLPFRRGGMSLRYRLLPTK